MSAVASAQPVAFPGAEGEGRFVSGGRGGDVYHVTNLNDSGTGSLRYGIESARSPRTIVFDVSGAIPLRSGLRIRRPNLTIAGETAPAQGISIVNYGLQVDASNVMMRHLRVRPGDAAKGPKSEGGFYGDAISIGRSDVILDHISAAWGIDEVLSVAGSNAKRVTVQYSIMSEGLDQSGLYHDEWDSNYAPGGSGHHSNGSLIKPRNGNGVVTFHHNLWSNNTSRNPSLGNYSDDDTLRIDLRNNVLSNNSEVGYSSGESKWIEMNYVGNYIFAGYNTYNTRFSHSFKARADNNMRIYESGNKADSNRNDIIDGIDNPPDVITGIYSSLDGPVSMAPVTTHTADEGLENVLSGAGAFFWNRDAVDARLISEVGTVQGRIIDSPEEVGGYPTLSVEYRDANWDTDADGMPNWWEEMFTELDPARADNNGDFNVNGYTNLEEYLHHRASGEWVPEPSSSMLLLMALGQLLRRRRDPNRR